MDLKSIVNYNHYSNKSSDKENLHADKTSILSLKECK